MKNFRGSFGLRPQTCVALIALFFLTVAFPSAGLSARTASGAGGLPQSARAKEEWDYFDSYRQWFQQRAYPNDDIDWKAYAKAFVKRDMMPSVELNRAPGLPPTAPPPRWEFVGPKNLPVPYRIYYGEGTTSGRVNGVAFDPRRSGTYYVATAGGGLWKTTDGGRRWTALSNNDQWMYPKLSSISVDPHDSNTIYVGTGDFDGGRSIYGFGIMKSTDGGRRWVNQGVADLSGYSVRRILIDPADSRIITVTAGRHPFYSGMLLRSTNGGASWTKPLNTDAEWCDIECSAPDSTGARRYYAVGQTDTKEEVWRSDDSGASWQKLSPPLNPPPPPEKDKQHRLDVACSAVSPETVYLLSGGDAKVFKSTDSGKSWQDITNKFPNGTVNKPEYNWSLDYYACYIACSTAGGNQDMIYVGLVDIVASADGGANWQSVGKSYTDDALTHNDQHCIAVNPSNPNEALIGNDGGVYILRYSPPDNRWTFDTTLNANLGITQFYRTAFHPSDPTRMLGGAQDNATPVALGEADPGSRPVFGNWANVGGGDGGFCLINPVDSNIQYATGQFLDLYRTDNNWAVDQYGERGESISYSEEITTASGQETRYWNGEPADFNAPIAMDPKNPNIIYAGTNYLWRWDETQYKPQDPNAAWTRDLGNKQLSAKGVLSYIAVSPSDSNRIYTGSIHGEVWMSKDRGENWDPIDIGTSPATSLPRRWVKSIAIDPTDANRILVALSGTSGPNPGDEHPGHLWRCSNTTDANITWSKVTGIAGSELPNIPINCVVIEPDDPKKIYYVGTDVGFFLTRDGGARWANGTTRLGLPNVQVNDLQLVPRTGYLMAATYGRGLWRIKLPVNVMPAIFDIEPPSAAVSPSIKLRISEQLSLFATKKEGTLIKRKLNSMH